MNNSAANTVENTTKNSATIWNNNRQLTQPVKKPVTQRKLKPVPKQDSGLWIDKLMER